MRKLTYLLVLLGLIAFSPLHAQYYDITANPGSAFGANIAYDYFADGTNCQVRKTGGFGGGGGGSCQSGWLASTGFCGVWPYYIGNCYRNGYKYKFSKPVTDIRIVMVSLNDDDTIRVAIPCYQPPGGGGGGGGGNPCTPKTIVLTAASLSNFSGTCTPTKTAAIITGGPVGSAGRITALGAPSGFSDVQIDIQNPYPPYTIDSIRIDHVSRFPGFSWNSDGVVYGISYKRDSCNLRLNVRADSPRCAKKQILLEAVDLPNTKHYWFNRFVPAYKYSTGPTAVITPTQSLVQASGWYYDSAVRGACTYKDSIFINIDLTPSPPQVAQKGPKCPGETDTMTVASSGASGITYEWFRIGSFFGSAAENVEMPNLTLADAGTYGVSAKSSNGCISDTAYLNFQVNPPAFAIFQFLTIPLCGGKDSVIFTNYSVGGNNSVWDFGDATPASSQFSPTHVYNSASYPASYLVKLTAGSSVCKDDTTVTVAFDHPVIASFTFDTDSILCQGTPITFKNTSTVAPGSIPNYLWNYKDGSTYNDVEESHTYTKYGKYRMFLTATDYIGCEDTAWQTFEIDSAGSISFIPSDTSLCVGKVVNFYGKYSPYGLTVATWDLDDGNLLLDSLNIKHAYDVAKDGGAYHVKFTADYRVCDDITATADINVHPMPLVDLGPDTAMCPNGQPILIRDLVNAGDPNFTWRWNTDIKDSTSSIKVYHPGVYSVSANAFGCITTDSMVVFKKCYVDIPNVFTPNGDGNNDYFLPREWLSKGINKFNLMIFNRWGGKVFETTSINGRGWDGKFNGEDQSTGVYIYLVEATFENGTSEKYQGNVTLLR